MARSAANDAILAGNTSLRAIRYKRNVRYVPGSIPRPCTSLRKRGLVPKTETLKSFKETRHHTRAEVNSPFAAEEPKEVPYVWVER